MIAHLTHVPRAVVVYFFVAPNQHIVQFDYPSLRQAKRDWPLALLRRAACTPSQPWAHSTYWEYHVPDSEYQKIHRVEPMRHPVLRYQGGETIPVDQLVGPTSRSKRKPKHVVLKPSERSVARRLREQQTFSQDEPPIRASRRVHRTYWEDVWETRREERSWKGHREHQWR